jgi:hypothetical protein
VATRKNGAGRTLIKATLNSRLVTRKYGGKAKASMDDLKMWLSGEVVSGCFRDGIEISKVYEKFEADTGKVIDLNHLGYSKLSKLLRILRTSSQHLE